MREWIDTSGSRVRSEFYNNGKLCMVRYFSGDLATIRSEHAREYPEVRFSVVRVERAPAGFRWTLVAQFAADGTTERFFTHLTGPGDEDLMSVEYTLAGDVIVITKYWDEMADESGMAFEYGSDGRNHLVVDLEDGDTLNFEAVLGVLCEPDFYADGFALPPQLAGTPIPAARDRF